MPHTVYMRFTVFSNFSNLQFVLHILTFSKLATPVMRIMLTIANIV